MEQGRMPLLKSSLPETAPPAGRPALADLRHALVNGTDDQRRAAARDLVAFRDEAVPALAARLQAETSPSVRAAILTTLSQIDTAEAAAAITPLLASQNAPWRTTAIDALRTMPQAAAGTAQDLLRDPDPDVRIMATEVLRVCTDARVPHWLADVLTHDEDQNVCAAALDVLADIGTADVLDAVAVLPDRFPANAFLRFACAAAATRLRDA
jgi:HEAT repeat protein